MGERGFGEEGYKVQHSVEEKLVHLIVFGSCSLYIDKGQPHIYETAEDAGDVVGNCSSSQENWWWWWWSVFYEASNLHLTHDLCSLKGGSGVHVSWPQSPGLNKDQGFSLLQLKEGVSRDPTLHPQTISPTCLL